MGVDLGRSRTRSGWAHAGVSLVLGSLVLAGCSGSDDAPPRPPVDPARATTSPGHGQAGVADVTLRVSTGARAGRLADARTDEVTREVGAVVDDWFEAAYLGGTWPRTDFSEVWPRFSKGLKARARQDWAITSNATVGARVDGVRAEKRRVSVDILAARTYPVGATARVDLVFVTSGDVRQRVRVRGELHLTPVGQRWQVFGYELARTATALPPPVPGATASATASSGSTP